MTKLVVTTTVPNKPGSAEPYLLLGPGDDVPEWAAAQLGAHCFEGGEHPYPDSDYPAKPVKAKSEPKAAPPLDGPPPKAGAGSTTEAWAAHAATLKVDVPADAKRDDIIAAVAAAGHPVDPQ